jgi:hypothetical protein
VRGARYNVANFVATRGKEAHKRGALMYDAAGSFKAMRYDMMRTLDALRASRTYLNLFVHPVQVLLVALLNGLPLELLCGGDEAGLGGPLVRHEGDGAGGLEALQVVEARVLGQVAQHRACHVHVLQYCVPVQPLSGYSDQNQSIPVPYSAGKKFQTLDA